MADRLSADQVVEERDDIYRIEATVVDSVVLDRWLWDLEQVLIKSTKCPSAIDHAVWKG